MPKKRASRSHWDPADASEGSECSFLPFTDIPYLKTRRSCMDFANLLARSFAYAEMNLILAKMLWRWDLELVNKDLDWEGQGRMHVMWWKPSMYIRILPRSKAE
jgi:hypothetical protein